MTTYYISPDGSDSNNGLGPDASDATNKPWLTLGKAVGAVPQPGDTIYWAPGYYNPISVVANAGCSSVASPLNLVGDPTNAQGFKTAAGVLLAPGIPWISTRTLAEGIDAPPASAGNIFQQDTTACHGLRFTKLVMESAGSNIVAMAWDGSTDWVWTDCAIFCVGKVVNFNSGASTAGRNHIIRQSVVMSQVGFVGYNTTTAAASADADLNLLVEECLWFGGPSGTAAWAPGSGTGNLCGGINWKNTTFVVTHATFFTTTAGRTSTVVPITFTGCLVFGPLSAGLSAGTSGEIIDGGYNRWSGHSFTAYTNVTVGTGTVFKVAPNLVLPHLVKWGLEMPRADMFGWTDAAHANQKFSASGIVTPDFFGRTARPWGTGASIGCMQAKDAVQDNTSAIIGGGVSSLKLTGAGEVSFYLPVNVTNATINISTKSLNYSGSNYPQLIVQANPSIGVTEQTATATDATEQTISTGVFSVSAPGVVEVRVISRSASTGSATYFDVLVTV